MSGRLAGRAAVVTGGGSGIGRCAALRFAAEGAAVAVLDFNAEAGAETAAMVEKDGGRAVSVAVDVADAGSVDAAVGSAAAELGPLHVLLNNAGIAVGGSILDVEEDAWDRCFAVNTKGTYLCSRAFARHAVAPEGGYASIVNIASVAGLVAIENSAAYCGAKGAVISLTRSMAEDLAKLRIRVNAICPGTVHTPLIDQLITARGGGDHEKGMAMTVSKYPIGRLGTPEEIASVAAFLAGEDSSFLTGAIIAADGGMTTR